MPTEPATGSAPGLPDLTVRSATLDDLDEVAALFSTARRAAVPSMPPPVHTPEEDRGWLAEQLAGQAPGGREAWLAERDGAVLGLLLLDGGWLHSLYVDPQHQGHGVGSLLLDVAKGLRPDGLDLWVFETNTCAQRLYAREGFGVVERTDGARNDEHAPDVRMVWPR